jgi:hypothetical protein
LRRVAWLQSRFHLIVNPAFNNEKFPLKLMANS